MNVFWCSRKVKQLGKSCSVLKPYLSREAGEGAVKRAKEWDVRCCPLADYERPSRKRLIVDRNGRACKEKRACSGVQGGEDEREAISTSLGYELDELSAEDFLDVGDRAEGVSEIFMDETLFRIVW